MRLFSLAWRQLRRDLAAGDIRILVAALVLAVVAVSAVGFVTDRAERMLASEANRLLGGDAVVRGDAPIAGRIREAANLGGLKRTETVEMPTMVRVGAGEAARLKLGELRALGDGFPLRGGFRIRDARGERDVVGGPAAGTLWLSRAGADQLDAKPGDRIGIGEREFTLAAVVLQEPDGAIDYFNVAPKVFLPLSDLPSTGLIQPGSRAGYKLVIAGEPAAVESFVKTAKAAIGRGQRLETIADARPEIRSALDRASRFLGLAALVSVVLAAVAVAMAARRHSERHLSGAAVMRCLGASQRTLAAIHIGELLILGVLASGIGVAIAYALQWGIGLWLADLLKVSIPPASLAPALQGLGVGLVVLLSFGAPPVLALRRVPALRVLRRDLDVAEPSAWLVALAGFSGLGALLWWQAGSATLGAVMLLGIVATLAALASIAWALILVVRRARSRLRGSLRYGLANVSRRAGTSIAQVSALGLGLMALLLLTFVRTDLIDRWRLSLSDEAPNRFIVNVQPDQMTGVRDFLTEQGIAAPTLYPMIRGRLVEHNGKPVTGAQYAEDGERARRLAEREFNLSTAESLGDDNQVTAGKLWPAKRLAKPELSVEEEFAARLKWKIGDRVAFDIAGQRFEATITSFRKVEWESFKPNFFVVASPGALEGYSGSYITAVKVPPTRPRFTAQLVERYPNLTVIDVDAILTQVRSIGDQVARVVQVVFWFSLAAGVLVLLAAVSASQDERLREGGVMRALGGSRRQLRLAQASEFAAIGLLSGVVAAVAASVLAGVVATQVFDLPWEADWGMAATGAAIGIAAALVAGLFATRRVLDAPPSITLRELDA
ncbi:ABC transporter permease [Lysobacter brunescens]|uniref:ABC transporter permease n=1 Tax=Lysobacter brunescens TaxID=262323 RepID=A0ABW2YB25_9GAMM